jgi:predicted acylesterase/phospholipase RssA
VIGASFASGLGHDEVHRRVREASRSQIAIPNPLSLVAGVFADALLLASPLAELIRHLVPAASFDDLKLPFLATVTDLRSGTLRLCGSRALAARHPEVTDGFPLQLTLEASCALPLYYEPVLIYGRRYADGGLRAVLPIEAARLFAPDRVVAVDTGPGFDDIPAPVGGNIPIPPMVRAHGEALRILMAEQSERTIAAWPADGPELVVVRAVNETEATFARGSAERYVELGYEATRRALAEAGARRPAPAAPARPAAPAKPKPTKPKRAKAGTPKKS